MGIEQICDEIIDYYCDKRDDSDFELSENWVDDQINERSQYYILNSAERKYLYKIVYDYFNQIMEH